MADPRFHEQAKRFLVWRARQRSNAAGARNLAEANIARQDRRIGIMAVLAEAAPVDVMFEWNARGSAPRAWDVTGRSQPRPDLRRVRPR